MLRRTPAIAGFKGLFTTTGCCQLRVHPVGQMPVAERVNAIDEPGRVEVVRDQQRGDAPLVADVAHAARVSPGCAWSRGCRSARRRAAVAARWRGRGRWRFAGARPSTAARACAPPARPGPRARATAAPGGALAQRASAAGQLDRGVVERRGVGHQVKGLEDEAHVPAAVERAVALGQLAERASVEGDAAAVGARQRRRQQQQGRLARAAGTVQGDELPAGDGQRDAIDGLDGLYTARIVLDDLAQLERAHCPERSDPASLRPGSRTTVPRSSVETSSPSAIDISTPTPCSAAISSEAIRSVMPRSRAASRNSA